MNPAAVNPTAASKSQLLNTTIRSITSSCSIASIGRSSTRAVIR
jgi:hypothetical protein